MRLSTYEKLKALSASVTGYVYTPMLLKQGLTNRQIAALTDEGKLEKIAHGCYWIPETGREKPADYKAVEVGLINSNAVICADSACFYQGFIDVEPKSLSIATRRDDRHKMTLPFKTTRHYYAVSNFTDCQKAVETPFGSYLLYDIDRSVCDCIRFQSDIDPKIYQIIIEKYKTYQNRNLDRFYAYAKAMRVERSAKAAGVD